MEPATPDALPGPAEPGEGKPVWYRRRAPLIAGGVAVVVAVTVISDLPQHTSLPREIANETAVVREIDTDVSPCTFAVQEAFTIYQRETRGSLSSSDRAHVPGLLRDDQGACSFTDNSIFNLSNIEVPGSAAGRHIGDMVTTVTLWASSDALAAIEAIQTLSSRPADTTARVSLAKAEQLLASDRAKADAELQAANRVLRAHLTDPALPQLPVPSHHS